MARLFRLKLASKEQRARAAAIRKAGCDTSSTWIADALPFALATLALAVVAYWRARGIEPTGLPAGAAILTAACLLGYAAVQSWRCEKSLHREAEALAARVAELEREKAETLNEREAQAHSVRLASELAELDNQSTLPTLITRHAVKHLRGSGAILLVWNERAQAFRPASVHGRGIPAGEELAALEVAASALPSISEPVSALDSSDFRDSLLRGLFSRWRTHRVLCGRIDCGERICGWLLVARTRKAGSFSERDRSVMAVIARHTGGALAQAELVAQLRAANDLKDEFMATMSHELRTPLNLIMGYTDMHLDGGCGEISAEQADTLRRVRQQSSQLLEIIQSALDVSRLERGLMAVSLREISLPQVIEDMQRQIPHAWRRPAVGLHWRTEPGLPRIRTDPGKLRILLRSLIHNALKFTRQGQVTVSVSASADAQRVTFVVQDSGCGMDSEDLSAVFEMFRQVRRADGMGPGGIGLGLYIASHLATVLGATIDVTSTPGRGSTFRVHVPINGPLAPRSLSLVA